LAIDKAAILKQAQHYTSRGQYDKAIAEWQKLITTTPADAAIQNTIGDLQAKRNAPGEAVEAYLQAAAFFKASGDALKAIAVYRKVLKLEPHRYAVYQKLGDLNAERGLVSSAILDYTTLCKLFLKEGRTRDALQVYRTMAKIDPSNLEVKQRIAEVCMLDNQRAEAIEAYLDLGRECQSQQRREQAQAAYEAASKIEPGSAKIEKAIQALDNPSTVQESEPASAASPKSGEGAGRQVLLEAAGRQIQSGEYGDAEAALMEMLSREPGDPEVCRLLARLHLKRGEMSVAMGEFQFLAGAAMRAEDYALAEAMLMEYLEVDPHCALLMESLGQVYEQKGDTTGAVERYGQALSMLLERPDPDQPTLPQDLFGKIKELAPGSEAIARFTELLRGGMPSQMVRDLEGLERIEVEREAREPVADSASATSAEATSAVVPESPAEGGAPQLDAQEAQTRYDLGVAYKNMGLFDEALEELKQTVTMKEHFLDSCCMMADCMKEQGDCKAAVTYYEQALTAVRDDERASGIRYELALLYEADGELEKAVQTLAALEGYRDAPKRLDRIKAGRTAAAGSESEPVLSAADANHGSEAQPRGKKRRVSYL
jgi:tetratricopeptide (TPR) repeat protein